MDATAGQAYRLGPSIALRREPFGAIAYSYETRRLQLVRSRLAVEVVCSSGTFIRAIGRDLAAALGTTAVMESLVRTAIGSFEITSAVPLAKIERETAARLLLPAGAAVTHLERITLDGDLLARAVRGGLLDLPTDAGAVVAAFGADGELVGILRRHDSGGHRLRPNFLGLG